MVASISSNNNLSAYFTNLIENLMTIERQPLDQLTQQRDQVTLTRSVYVDLQAKIDDLRNSLGTLNSKSPFFTLTPGRSTNVTNTTDGATVATASASSSAVPGTYDIQVNKLALADRWVSTLSANPGQPAGLSYSDFWLGATGPNSQAASVGDGGDPNGLLSTLELGSVTGSQHELGTGAYSVQTQLGPNQEFQFRLVDADNNAVSIKNSDGNFTTGWQTVTDPSAEIDTGRGLKLRFSANAADNAGSSANVNYVAGGTSISISTTDTLADIAGKINAANQPDGHRAAATVIGNNLVLTAAQTGLNHATIFADSHSTPNFGFTQKQNAQNADFMVNGIQLYTQSNTNLTNVINGVTLNLAGDATYNKIDDVTKETKVIGRSATLVVTSNNDSAKNNISDFITKFNSLQSYLADKTGVTQNADNTYTRGALSDDSSFSELRSNLFSMIVSRLDSGVFKSLGDIGITIDDNLQLSISNSSKLDSALNDHMSDVNTLMDSIMGSLDTVLGRFGGSSGYLNQAAQNLNYNLTDLNNSIKEMNSRLDDRQTSLYNQYADIQAQLQMLAYTQQTMSAFYGTTSTSA
ncbi:MAG TPA: flagellar filament capping protein FliD [Anaerolineaceae bacterium]|nr:flagellar filament capping protein FliD [Anaerolineaceae bacterium]